MFPKPPRPEPPRRAIATQVVRQRETGRAPDFLVVDTPAPPASPAIQAAADTPPTDPER
jgi:hypothetical protein